MERFPALRLILRLGRGGAAITALFVTVAALALVWNALGWLSLIGAPPVFAVSYFLAKSYVEIVQIITEMVH